jgi:cytochrome c-type biogenesis protein CcmH/NrfG
MSKSFDSHFKNLGTELRLQIDREINSMADPDWEIIFNTQDAAGSRKIPYRPLLRIAAFLALAVISYGGVKIYQGYALSKMFKLETQGMIDRIFAESLVKDIEFRLADNYKDVSDWLQELESSTSWYFRNNNNNYLD